MQISLIGSRPEIGTVSKIGKYETAIMEIFRFNISKVFRIHEIMPQDLQNIFDIVNMLYFLELIKLVGDCITLYYTLYNPHRQTLYRAPKI